MCHAQFIYSTNNGAITITGYIGPGGAVSVPSTIDGFPVTEIGTNAFYACWTLTDITLPAGVLNVGNYAFDNCIGLAHVTLPGTVTNLGNFAFYECASLTNVTIPNGVISIGVQTFCACTSLSSMNIPGSVTSIGASAFTDCNGMTNITVDAQNVFFQSVGGVLFNSNLTVLIQYPEGKAGNYTVPDGVTDLAPYVFYACTSLTNVVVPSSVTNIGGWAFSRSSVIGIYYMSDAPNLGSSVFSGTGSLTNYYIPGNIGWSTVYGGRPAVTWALFANVTGVASPAQGGRVTGSGAFQVGSTVPLAAVASNGWLFMRWNDGSTNNPANIRVPMTNTTYTATFVPAVTITARVNTNGAGFVTGSGIYPVGSNALLTVVASNNWLFSAWDDGSRQLTRTITVPPTNATYTALFISTPLSMALGVALNMTGTVWLTGGDANWSPNSENSRDGLGAKSGLLAGGQQSWIQTMTNGPAQLTFWWKVDSELSDELQFSIDGKLQAQLVTTTGWQQYFIFLGSTNVYTLRWTFAKNAFSRARGNGGWLDQVVWTPYPYVTHAPQLYFQEAGGMLASWVLNSTGAFQFTRVLGTTGSWVLKAAGDIDGDGVSDLLFQNAASDTGGWFMSADGSVRDARFWWNIGGWEIKAAGDYEGIGRAQIFFQTAAGAVAYWRLDTNGSFLASISLGNMSPWKLRGAGDLDGDHKAELFWQNATGSVAIWYHNPNGSIRGVIAFNTGEWALCGVTDVDGDGVSDLIWQTPDTRIGGWFMNTNGTARSANFWWSTGGWKLKAAGR